MSAQFDKDWHLQPIDGDTGQTFMGIRNTEKVFIKRNTTPLLAALSQEGITPKLVWVRRTSEGDVLSAQEWLEGRSLAAEEVGRRRDVVSILARLHQSQSLKNMLQRIGGQERSAFDFLREYAEDLPTIVKQNHYLQRVFGFLEDHLPDSDAANYRVCHGDPTDKNWLVADQERLYLVDWDASVLADPALDLGIILGRYVPYHAWRIWLKEYGVSRIDEALEKVQWYSLMDFLLRIKRYCLLHQDQKMNEEILRLKEIFSYS